MRMGYMKEEEYKARRDIERSMNDALSQNVKVSWEEILKIVVNDLVKKRCASREAEMVNAFDLILCGYYLSPDELAEAIKINTQRS